MAGASREQTGAGQLLLLAELWGGAQGGGCGSLGLSVSLSRALSLRWVVARRGEEGLEGLEGSGSAAAGHSWQWCQMCQEIRRPGTVSSR